MDARFRSILSEFLAKPISEPIFSVVSSIRMTSPWIRRFSPNWIANGVRIPLTVLRLTSMLRLQDLILSSCLRAVASSMPFPWIGEAKIIGFVFLFPLLWTWLNARASAAQLVLSSSLNGRLRSCGLCQSLFLPSLPVLLWTLFLYQWGLILLLTGQVRRSVNHVFCCGYRAVSLWSNFFLRGHDIPAFRPRSFIVASVLVISMQFV